MGVMQPKSSLWRLHEFTYTLHDIFSILSALTISVAFVFLLLVLSLSVPSIIILTGVGSLFLTKFIVHSDKSLSPSPSVHDRLCRYAVILRHEAQVDKIDHIVICENNLLVFILVFFVVTIGIPVGRPHARNRDIENLGRQPIVESYVKPAHPMLHPKINNGLGIHMGPGCEEKYHGEFLLPNTTMIPHVHDLGFGYAVIISDREEETVVPAADRDPRADVLRRCGCRR